MCFYSSLCRKTVEFTEGATNDNKAVPTSSNAAYGLMSHGAQQGGQSHEYELVALSKLQFQQEPTNTTGNSQQQTSPRIVPMSETETQDHTYECIAGN